MDLEELNPTEPTEAQSGGQESVVDSQESPTEATGRESVVDSRSNPDFAMVDESPGETPGEQRSQSREENAAIRAARIRAQRDAEASVRAQVDAEIAGLGIDDPYNQGRKLGSLDDLRAYREETQKRRLAKKAKETGRSVEELAAEEADRAYLAGMRREASARKTQEQARQWFSRDLARFQREHPEADAVSLENNPQFRRFCGSRFGREPLTSLYDDYVGMMGDAGKAAVAKASSHSARSTGGGSSGGAQLTREQKAELDRWNEENPEMAMTAKEFLRR